jgi:hypothetical protein
LDWQGTSTVKLHTTPSHDVALCSCGWQRVGSTLDVVVVKLPHPRPPEPELDPLELDPLDEPELPPLLPPPEPLDDPEPPAPLGPGPVA